MKRVLSLILAVLTASLVFSACGDSTGESSSPSSTPSQAESSDTESSQTEVGGVGSISYPLEGNPELSIAWETNTGILSYMTDWTYSDFFDWWQEDTGVTLTMSFPSDYSLLFASGDYPDMIFYRWAGYSGGPASAIDDGVIVALDEYLPEYAPDYYATITADDEVNLALKDANGQYYCFGYINESAGAMTTSGIWTRADWLTQLGIEAPKTLDEFTDMCYRMKDELGIEKVLALSSTYLRGYFAKYIITSAFGAPSTDWYQIDGTVHFGAVEDHYREVLRYLNQLYDDGIIDRDFQTIDTNMMYSNFQSGLSGVTFGWGTRMQTMLNEMAGQEFDLAAIRSLTKNDEDVPMYNGVADKINSYGTAITTACEDIPTACQFLNYCYTETGNILANYGREGVSFDYVDGEIVLNEEAIAENSIGYYSMAGSQGCYIRQPEIALMSINHQQILDAYQIWHEGDTLKYKVYGEIRSDEADENSVISSEVTTYISECFVKFINGSMDIETQWDEYLNTLKSMNVDRLIQIRQNALDDYNAR